jgi:hypothetical protein
VGFIRYNNRRLEEGRGGEDRRRRRLRRTGQRGRMGAPLQQRIDALPNVHIRVARVYTNGLLCVAVGALQGSTTMHIHALVNGMKKRC